MEVRERLAFDASQAAAALRRLKEMEPQAEFVLLSTCNRVELYYAGEQDSQQIAGRLVAFLSGFHGVEPEQFRPALYFHENEEAVRHLLLVAAGLDSMVVGEAQILGQVKESYNLACAAKSTGKILNRLFHCAFFTAKSVHTNTAISNGRVSVAGVAVELALQLFADIARAKVVVIGAGETGELVVQHLLKAGCTDVTVVNRTYERGVELAERCWIAVGKWEELGEQIGQANIVISSAAVPDYLYTRESFEQTINRRRAGSLLIIDVGVPRNFDPGDQQGWRRLSVQHGRAEGGRRAESQGPRGGCHQRPGDRLRPGRRVHGLVPREGHRAADRPDEGRVPADRPHGARAVPGRAPAERLLPMFRWRRWWTAW